ncbi:GTPase-associated protein 1-related protein [Streptomyces flavofungini]|uniref:GTPase-associated protein 1-related protein n=1 Tax=Streptomyces flavofungini TaxID=68200 RepID=UPI0025B1D09F|nr:GTPase-associated protein 1-related protein [Streptomyces flavofungini]WJV45522.1 GTPase-associated protein 1-related protein [Streptomyces flavofungini]
MAIRHLNYRLDEEPVTGTVRLVPVPVPPGPRPGLKGAAAAPEGASTRARGPASGAASEVDVGSGSDGDAGSDAVLGFGLDPGAVPVPVPDPDPVRDPDLHAEADADADATGLSADDAEVAEWVALAVGAGCGRGANGLGLGAPFSFSRLPDGAGLLCRTGGAGGEVRAIHLTGADAAMFADEWPVMLLAAGSALGAGADAGADADAAAEADGDAGADATADGRAGADADTGSGELPRPEGPFGRAELTRFARAHEPRVAPFLADVRRLFDDPAGRQLVLAEESTDTVARWIALACASLPPAYVPSLTFTTRATDPGRAPQHIVGIGPDADFDRFDVTTLDHLYRVHDGLDGPGSPPAADLWATWTARLWIAGVPLPRPTGAPTAPTGTATDPTDPDVPDGAAHPCPDSDAFSPTRLVPALLHAGLLSGGDLAELTGDALREAVAVLVGAVGADAAPLTALCRELHLHDRAAAESLALALARHRLAAAGPREVPAELAAVCDELPLGGDAGRALRAEYGGDADEALWRALREPPEAWVEPLRLAVAVAAAGGRGVDAAMKRLARALRNPEGTDRAQAVHVLDAVDYAPLTRRVLKMLGSDGGIGRLDLLRDLAASPQGDWLRRNLDDHSPLPLRLAVAAAHWGGPGDGLRGADLFGKLTEILPGRRVSDAATLRQVWRLVWRTTDPAPAELPWLARTCTVPLLVQAGLGQHVTGVVTAPDRVDQETVAFARDLLHERHLKRHQRATAQLLVLAQDLAERRLSLRQSVHRLQALHVDAAPLAVTVRRGVGELIAVALVRTDAPQLARAPVYDYLISSGPELMAPYRQLMLDERRREQLERDLPRQPEEISAYYYLWRPTRRPGVSLDWRQVAQELLHEILAPVVARLDERGLSEVATVIAGRQGKERVREWNAWRHGFHAR